MNLVGVKAVQYDIPSEVGWEWTSIRLAAAQEYRRWSPAQAQMALLKR
jgi:hypothetical protein